MSQMIEHEDKKSIWNTTGLAGEFFVLAELLKRGYQASFTLGNAKTVDIFTAHPKTGKTVRIQVKTNSGVPRKDNHSKWQVGAKILESSEMDVRDLVYVFVLLNPRGIEHPKYYRARAWDVICQVKNDLERVLGEVREGRRPYRGKLTPQARRDYPMKDFYSVKSEEDGYKFLTWEEIFS